MMENNICSLNISSLLTLKSPSVYCGSNVHKCIPIDVLALLITHRIFQEWKCSRMMKVLVERWEFLLEFLFNLHVTLYYYR